jgi:plasmid maintenance system antidote protein VapI
MTPHDLDRIGRSLYGTLYAADLARALGITPRAMQLYIKGERGIPTDMRIRLARVMVRRVTEIGKMLASFADDTTTEDA